ncbi:SprT-like domain-containing protein [Polynucleobacter necessarius]|uniref:SprT-like domain-containing protein n=1 Tax=Polynucleobacter necessarius TaxID=576610 RepID=UPI0018D5A09C|nr:SprT-like domain-containing protein [Polynucleobacter necessarius]
MQLLDTLVHELCHAVDDCFSGHGEDFKGIAQTVGLEGPARMAHATEGLTVKLMMKGAVKGLLHGLPIGIKDLLIPMTSQPPMAPQSMRIITPKRMLYR